MKTVIFDEQVTALAQFLGVDPELVSQVGNEYEVDGDKEQASYRVLTDREADEAWEEALDSYIDDCIMPELPETLANYFDDEKWKQDARYDGRGHALNYYDGTEEVETVDGTDYFIYRTN